MPDWTTTDVPGADAQGAGADVQTATPPTGGASQAGLTQAQVDAIVQKRLAQASGKHETEKAELQAKLDEANAQLKQHEDAKLSEAERLQQERDAARSAAEQAKADADAANLRALRAEVVADKCATLPAAYKALVQGTDAEALQQSADAAIAQYETDKAAILEGAKPPAQSIGAPSNAGTTTPPPASTTTAIADTMNLPPGHQRQNALIEALSKRAG